MKKTKVVPNILQLVVVSSKMLLRCYDSIYGASSIFLTKYVSL